ncbi:hypothetical protein LTS18_003404 [Coniosporium uncinatum]|uniref:Uncharacterized protein n=1 Tax=Coniosporium uncinatum TaxID=93489 RepID=A0ACC3D7D9_9PEZI|nr:hypothetical protein LTS18_003404 [Coniosporium uncinatum]
MVLGIDCFSRAGLKEFWLYIWSLNTDVFPIDTNTYPMTRGIIVEIACIIIFWLFGLMSQFKLWKFIKERREKRAADQLQEEENLEKLETEAGKRVQDETDRDRARWEAIYGDKDNAKIATESRSSGSIIETKDVSRITLVDVSAGHSQVKLSAKRASGTPSTTATTIPADEIQQIDAEGNTVSRYSTGANSTAANPAGADAVEASQDIAKPSGPAIVPLPFKIPTVGGEHDADDTDSVSAVPDVADYAYNPTRGGKRMTGTRVVSGDSFMTAEDGRPSFDRASSLAATIDRLDEEVASLPPLSRPPSQADDLMENGKSEPDQTVRLISARSGEEVPEPDVDDMNENEASAADPLLLSNPTSSTNPKPEDRKAKRSSLTSQKRHSGLSTARRESSASSLKSKSRALEPEGSGSESISGSLSGHLPEKLSKIALTYRTNEWAKHLTLADKPDTENTADLEPSSPGIQVDTNFAEASEGQKSENQKTEDQNVDAKPVQPTAYVPSRHRNGEPGRSLSQTSLRPESKPAVTVPSRPELAQGQRQQAALMRTPSTTSLAAIPERSESNPSNAHSDHAIRMNLSRNYSAPMVSQTLVESPIEGSIPAAIPEDRAVSPMPNTLLGKRDSMLRNRISTISFSNHPSAPNLAITTPSETDSARHVPTSEANTDGLVSLNAYQAHPPSEQPTSPSDPLKDSMDENMTLAQRKELMKQRRSSRESWPAPKHVAPRASVGQFDSHQPQRTSSGTEHKKREAMLASWRESFRQDTQTKQQQLPRRAQVDEDRRAVMLNEKRQQQMMIQRQAAVASKRESTFDTMMRRGDMIEMHKEALRKMQAKAAPK